MLVEEADARNLRKLAADFASLGQSARELLDGISAGLDPTGFDADAPWRLARRLVERATAIRTAAEELAQLARALREDTFSADLERIAGSARLLEETAGSVLHDATEVWPAGRHCAEAAAPMPEPAPMPPEPVFGETAKGGVILVVDDLEENRDILRRRLSRLGYQVELAGHGREALEWLAGHAADLILLDVFMPELDGFQTLTRLKENAATRSVPVIMLSSADEVGTVVKCIKLGADDFLSKPFNTTLLIARMEAVLAKKRLIEFRRAQCGFFCDKGTLQPDCPSYVERRADRELLEGLGAGAFCYVLTSRQMGKSSMMIRAARSLREQGGTIVALDLTAVGQNLTPEQWYDGLAIRMGRQLRLEDEVEDFWFRHQRLSPVQRFFTAMRELVLRQWPGVLVVFVDELDTVRSLPFSTDEFFAAIRECYNRRVEDAELSRLTFCLLGVATPSDLIRDSRTTLFNIGRRIELLDFTTEEAQSLNRGLGAADEAARGILGRILYWTGGHPYLTQRLCRAIAEIHAVHGRTAARGRRSEVRSVDRICEDLFFSRRAREEDDNLVFVQKLLLRNGADVPAVLALYEKIHRGDAPIPDDESDPTVNALRLSGIVRNVKGRLAVRNRIYHRVFGPDWIQCHRGG
jgi:DNA-binding response OmpR family regulator